MYNPYTHIKVCCGSVYIATTSWLVDLYGVNLELRRVIYFECFNLGDKEVRLELILDNLSVPGQLNFSLRILLVTILQRIWVTKKYV